MMADAITPMDVRDLQQRIADELDARRCDDEPGGFAPQRGEAWSLYGSIGAVNVNAALGLPMGDAATRRTWAQRLLACCNGDGTIDAGPSGQAHGLCMLLASLHLLGADIPDGLGPLAPLDVADLHDWLANQDWNSTHKGLWGSVTPVLATGLTDAAWRDVLLTDLANRIDPARPLETWCKADAPSWRVISCVYHIGSALDAGCVPYPHASLLLDRILGLQWDKAPDDRRCTDCTDGDWAWLLLRLAEMCPDRRDDLLTPIRRVSARRIQQWHYEPQSVLGLGTFFIYCWLWSTAVFQHACRDHYVGPFIRDTLNDPTLFRLR